MDNLPSQKTLAKFFWAVSVLLGIALGLWISLYFITEMEKLREYAIVYKYWYGVYLTSKFICLVLASCWVILIVLRLVVLFVDETKKPKRKNEEVDTSIEIGDLSNFD